MTDQEARAIGHVFKIVGNEVYHVETTCYAPDEQSKDEVLAELKEHMGCVSPVVTLL